ncbi:hypothetical protein [Blastopirellula marina]|uniref:Uncharacterized protein n=1 Tax=Blastopirellula marina TaxID=124 RepID=A0A2S8G157_9BACT|nr:hypothetical protein [Blastopirellula marina]PQO38166.1 hypothetical protein C5Y98_08815 [Blastopirellula marina]PTL44822.1 hypothetical protein C5Y97_08820 [Blastopirellula marina]
MKRTKSFLKPKQPRQGALLLVVLSILVLFALVGLTFVVGANAFNTGSQANLRRDVNRNTPPAEADTIVMDLLRGPRAGSTSRLFMQDLLRDMWGNQSVIVNGNTTVAHPNGTNQLWQIDITSPSTRLSPINEFYTGSIVTFTSGDAKGQSHRILHYKPTWNGSSVSAVTLVIDQDPETVRESLRGTMRPNSGDSFVINDPAFNGTGFGYNTVQASGNTDDKRNLDLLDRDGHPVALVPNIAYAYPKGWVNDTNGNPVSIEAGGADESYDAPDFHNLYLSYIYQDGTPTVANTLPSFHRPDLIQYWMNNVASSNAEFSALDATDRLAIIRNPDITTLPSSMAPPSATLKDAVKKIRRKLILRPLIEDHPHFTGSNGNFDIFGTTTNARWDIDNDLDGVTDSIWIDVGLPMKTDAQGRRYKPLAAILVKDLDGLINLNAHGSYAHYYEFLANSMPTAQNANTVHSANDPNVFPLTHGRFSPAWQSYVGMSNQATAAQMVLPQGSGYGPADVSLQTIFTVEESYRLLHQRYLDRAGSFSGAPAHPGIGGIDDPRSRMAQLGLADNGYTNVQNNLLGMPLDRYGIGRTYFDLAGRPRFQPAFGNGVMGNLNDITAQQLPTNFGPLGDDPYEADLVNANAYDTPFTYQEYERIARYAEYDSSEVTNNEDRLLQYANSALTNVQNRNLVSVASFQVPAPNRVDVPRDLRSSAEMNKAQTSSGQPEVRFAPTLVGLCQKRLLDNGVPANQLNDAVRQLLPPEILRGEPLDLNRLLESPPNSSGNTDIFQLQAQQIAQFQSSADTPTDIAKNTGGFGRFNGTNNLLRIPSPTGATSYSATRQLMARHLYVMMLLLMEEGYQFPAFDSTTYANTTPLSERDQLTKRRIAQWAINVVDFRDKDAVMTPFEYDLQPFTPSTPGSSVTWNVDGNLLAVTGANPAEDTANRRVVWGAEAPDLVMTETLAFHDRGAKDTSWDDNASNSNKKRGTNTTSDDQTLDQYKIPQGSLFLEFYNPRNILSNNPAVSLPRELYNANGQLVLNKRSNNGNGAPVWRVLITERESNSNSNPAAIPREMANRIDTINFQPTSTDGTPMGDMTPSVDAGLQMLPSATEDYRIDRVIYFANYQTDKNANPLAPGRDREFHFRGNAAEIPLEPNQYFVVAPRHKTIIGSKRDSNDAELNDYGSRSLEVTNLNAAGYGQFREIQTGTAANVIRPYPVFGSAIRTNVAIAVTADLPDDFASAAPSVDPDGLPAGIGLSVSEPLRNDYYPVPTDTNPNPNINDGITQFYTDGSAETAPDIPFEGPGSSHATYPLNDPNFTDYKTGTYPNKSTTGTIDFAKGYKDAVLQRLANPVSDFHATLNPYITVDTMPIDLTVYNGEDGAEGRTGSAAMVNPEDWDPVEDGVNAQASSANSGVDLYFGSRERGKRDNDPLNLHNATPAELNQAPSNGNLLSLVSQVTSATIGNADLISQVLRQSPPNQQTDRDTTRFPEEHFGRPLLHTLGYVNRSYGSPITNSTMVNGAAVNLPYIGSPMPAERRNGDPTVPQNPNNQVDVNSNPFTWLHWANGPFVSKYDLMMVPSSSPQRLLYEYSLVRTNGGSEIEPYNVAGTPSGDDVNRFFAPYTYLLNFFHGSKTYNLTGSSSVDQKSAQLARIFDFVTVPSRYNGTQKWFAAANFNASTDDNDARADYMFPFNRRSMFREPGKINLNTIPAEKVYNAIFDPTFWQNGNFVNFPTWDVFQASRQGYDTGNAAQFPSRFGNPFRSAASSEMVPDLSGGNANALKVAPVDATILRSRDPLQQISGIAGDEQKPLFDLRLSNSTPGNMQANHYRTDDNPMLRYQAYQRLGNIAGTQSNVFAVWITIGYFEVEPTTVDAEHPDGWQLGQELGIDTGEIERHRAFYIIDRSIPVGYLPGEDLNVEDTIMLRRFIE